MSAATTSNVLYPNVVRPKTGARPRGAAARVQPTARVQIVPPELKIADGTAAAVFRTAAARGPICRDQAAAATGASIATVNRQVSAMLAAGLLRERPELIESGAVGRPRVPFETDHERYLTVGIHVGAAVTGIVASDLRGRVIGGVEIPTPRGGQEAALGTITGSARAFAARWHRRMPLWAGVALGGRVDSATGTVDHPRLGWADAPVGAVVSRGLGLPVSVAAHVEAMAASELLLTPDRDTADVEGATLYFYARETVGIAIAFDGRVHTPRGGPGSVSHLPTGSSVPCACGARGCLEATVADRAVLARARAAGLLDARATSVAALYALARNGSREAHEILAERAQVLGRSVAMLRDLFNPDRVILGGQAFTAYPAAAPHVARALGSTSGADVRVTGFGDRVQAHAASVVSLSSLYSDPLGAMRRALS